MYSKYILRWDDKQKYTIVNGGRNVLFIFFILIYILIPAREFQIT